MKKIIIFTISLLYLMGCGTLNKGIITENKQDSMPLLVGTQEIVLDDNVNKATDEGKILEGMTTEMVEKSWGIPDSKIQASEELTIWEYRTINLKI